MRLKLMTAIFVTALGLLAAPLAAEQLRNLKGMADRWSNDPFLNSIVTVEASAREKHAPQTLSYSLASAPAPAQSSEEFRWSGRVAAGRTVEIKGVNGGVSAEPASGGEVEVVAAKSSNRSDTRQVEIRVVEHEGGVTICAVYPNVDSDRPNQCVPGEGGHMNVRDNDVRVEFKVRVPQGVRFNGRTVNGDVETGALGSDVDAKTVNGDIRITAAGVARAKTVNGAINASLGNGNWSGPLEFHTVNGTITLDLPANTNADVQAQTVNGSVTTDFPMTVQGTVSRKRLNGTIGGGGRELSLKTVNGSIRLRRAS